MKNYLETLIEEKGIDIETVIEVEGNAGMNFIPLAIVIDAIDNTCEAEQKAIKKTLVMIDFKNGDIMHFFKHLAQAIAV